GEFIDEFAIGGPLNVPGSITFGPQDGNLYVTSQITNSVVRYDSRTGAFVDEFVKAGDGGLVLPTALLFGLDGNLLVASGGTNAVLRCDGTTGQLIEAFVSPDSNLNGGLSVPTGLVYTIGTTGGQ